MRRTIALALGAAFATTSAMAQVILSDGNSTATIDPSNNLSFLRGLNQWSVDDVEQVFQQWYWFRVGDAPERSIDTLGGLTITQTAANSANLAFSNGVIAIDVTFTLIGGSAGSGTADLGEIVRVRNLSNSSLSFHLFEYDDFDLSGTADDDLSARLDSSSIRQWDALSAVTVGTVEAADHWQIGDVPSLFDLLDDGAPSNLSDSSLSSGPSDRSFAFQWDRVIGAGGTFLMSKNKLVQAVPEPISTVGIALGLALMGRKRRRA